MRTVTGLAAVGAVLALGAFAFTASTAPPPKTARVMVHCPAGNHAAFVTPPKVTIAVGDSVRWKATGQAVDSLIITLKDPEQAWPFTGHAPRGGDSTWTGGATTTGTYGYNVTVHCRVGGHGDTVVVIDPDIIIQ